MTRMLLLDNRMTDSMRGVSQPLQIDLLGRWWDLDDIPKQSRVGLAGTRLEQKNRPSLLQLDITRDQDNALSGHGGPIFMPPYIEKGIYEMHVVLGETAASDGKPKQPILLNIRSGNTRLVEAEVKPGTRSVQRFQFEESGFANYLTIAGNDVTSVEIKELTIVPARNGTAEVAKDTEERTQHGLSLSESWKYLSESLLRSS